MLTDVFQSRETREIDVVKQVVAEDYGISVRFMSNSERRIPVPEMRHIAMTLSYELTLVSHRTVADCFKRVAGMAIHAEAQTKVRRERDPVFDKRFKAIRQKAIAALEEHRRKRKTA